ncbi:MAG: ribulose-phosphate 3-epimerase [Candidatus Omnitrophota bacterium]|nr:MAG: ribulose-phosphate 3-epimerase [Candidatus Omnitrophota bacterium]
MKAVVPALLTDKREKFVEMLEVCRSFTDYVQVDIMDGEFVPSRSILAQDLKGLNPNLRSEAHLMVINPLDWLDTFKSFGASRIIYHFEIEADHFKIINEIKNKGFEAGIAINPSTEIKDFEFLLDKVSVVLFLSVNPGFYGAPFIPQVLDKIKAFKKLYPNKLAGIDGGVKLTNAEAVSKSGVDYVCVGSALMQAQDPQIAYKELLKKVNG